MLKFLLLLTYSINLDGLVNCMLDLIVDASTDKKILSLRDRIILIMVKVKLNMNFTAIAVLFNISTDKLVQGYDTYIIKNFKSNDTKIKK